MHIEIVKRQDGRKAAVISSEEVVIRDVPSALDLIMNVHTNF